MAIFNGVNIPMEISNGSGGESTEYEMTDDSDEGVEDIIEQQVRQLTVTAVKEIKDSLKNMAKDVEDSKRQLEESEVLMNEVMQDMGKYHDHCAETELPPLDIPADPVEVVDIIDDNDPPSNGNTNHISKENHKPLTQHKVENHKPLTQHKVENHKPLTQHKVEVPTTMDFRRSESEIPIVPQMPQNTTPAPLQGLSTPTGPPPEPLNVLPPSEGETDINPAQGPVIKRLPVKGDQVYGLQVADLLEPWLPAKVLEVVDKPSGETAFKVKFEDGAIKTLNGKQIAEIEEAKVRLPVGSRCITLYLEDDQDPSTADYFAAVVAERPKVSNKGRYLMFYDDGYASYMSHSQIRLVYQAANDVWLDVHKNSRDFVKSYMQSFPRRRLVKLEEGNKIKAELSGDWLEAEVTEVVGSLAMIVFPDEMGCEWIYRGSSRLGPIAKSEQEMIGEMKRKKPPPKGVMNQVKLTPSPGPRNYIDHVCSPVCNTIAPPYHPLEYETTNPLLIPVLHGWRREVGSHVEADFKEGNWSVLYIAPCGRRLRDLDEIHAYLRIVGSNLQIDYFAFDCWLKVMNQYIPKPDFLGLADISHGQERMPLSASNSYDSSYPPLIEYSTVPIPQKEVEISSDPNFLVGCDCTDDCANKGRCACWQLTIQSTVCDQGGRVNTEAGYVNRRLQDVVLTGIYECNKTCACADTCLNRLAQFPIRSRLQIFKTENRGWGIRILDDLPQGAFICTYVGKLYGPEEGNKQGTAFGDDYFADLDMIEVVEARKDGYESDVTDIEAEEAEETATKVAETMEGDSPDSGDNPTKELNVIPGVESEKEKNEVKEESTNEEMEIEVKSELESKEVDVKSENEIGEDKIGSNTVLKKEVTEEPKNDDNDLPKHKSVRKYFSEEEDIYIMDAMTQGNIGRYLNHSCDPNVFVQNVFVNTHDLRFPTIAFFALKFVPAGSELCWNYNYEVGTVENKQIICNCGAPNCKGRLL